MSRPEGFVAVDFAPPRPSGRRPVWIASAAVALLVIGVLVVGVTQLLLR